VSFTAMQEGQSLGDTGLSIHATIESDPEHADKPQVEVEFDAQEGKGEDLKKVLAKIVSAAEKAEMLPPEAFTFESTDDTAKTVFIPPVDDDEEFANDMEEGMDKVNFESSLKLGRTLDELYDDKEEHLPMSLHGIRISAQAAFADAMCGAMEQVSNELGEPMDKRDCEMLRAVTRFNVSYDMRYQKPADMSEEVKQAFPTLNQLMGMVAGPLSQLPKDVKDAMKELDGLTKGIKSIAIRGLPHKFEVVFDCKNFKVSSVVKKLIELTEPQES